MDYMKLDKIEEILDVYRASGDWIEEDEKQWRNFLRKKEVEEKHQEIYLSYMY